MTTPGSTRMVRFAVSTSRRRSRWLSPSTTQPTLAQGIPDRDEIDSDKAGTVTKVLVDNGQAVEYGQPLFIIE